MLDRTTIPDAATGSTEVEVFTPDEVEVFSQARAAGAILRRSWESWVALGKAAMVARRHANAAGGSQRARPQAYKAIVTSQGLDWLAVRKSEGVRLIQVMARLPEVEAWRAGLTDYERTRFGSPQSNFNRCPIFHPDGHTKGVKVTDKPMTVRQLLSMTAADAAKMIYARVPAKAWALMRALEELTDSGAAPKPMHGREATRRKQAAASQEPTVGVA